MRSGRLAVGLSSTLSALVWTSVASASPAVIAEYCSETELECTVAQLDFDKTKQLPVAFSYDTGWIPPNSDLQVKVYAELPAYTRVELSGDLETTWPNAMMLATPGGGPALLQFEYGLAIGAQAKIDLTVAGIGIKWTGDIPFVPKIDFKIAGQKEFSSWAFEPNGVSTSGLSPKVRLFDVNLLGLVGIPSQLSKGGVALDVAGELEATYQTERIRVEPAGGSETSIQSHADQINRPFPGGAFVEYDVWPEGRVDYKGTLHIIPTLFVEVLGKDFSMPLVDIPVTLSIGSTEFIFDPVRVHVPLPDFEPVPVTLDFGTVSVGGEKRLAVDLSNVGEAKARANAFFDSSHTGVFQSYPPEVLVASMASKKVEIAFSPKSSGPVKTELTFVTNDPDQRFMKITLLANGAALPDEPLPDDPKPSGATGETGGCGCRAAGDAPSGGLWLGALVLGAFAWRRRRPAPWTAAA